MPKIWVRTLDFRTCRCSARIFGVGMKSNGCWEPRGPPSTGFRVEGLRGLGFRGLGLM